MPPKFLDPTLPTMHLDSIFHWAISLVNPDLSNLKHTLHKADFWAKEMFSQADLFFAWWVKWPWWAKMVQCNVWDRKLLARKFIVSSDALQVLIYKHASVWVRGSVKGLTLALWNARMSVCQDVMSQSRFYLGSKFTPKLAASCSSWQIIRQNSTVNHQQQGTPCWDLIINQTCSKYTKTLTFCSQVSHTWYKTVILNAYVQTYPDHKHSTVTR